MTLRQLLAHSAVKGLCVGQCIDGDPWEDTRTEVACLREVAHAHVRQRGPAKHPGWICIRQPRNILRPHSRHVSADVMHELAHLLANTKGHHNEVWRKVMAELGQPVPAAYKRRSRSVIQGG